MRKLFSLCLLASAMLTVAPAAKAYAGSMEWQV
jgi:hypothetical protein